MNAYVENLESRRMLSQTVQVSIIPEDTVDVTNGRGAFRYVQSGDEVFFTRLGESSIVSLWKTDGDITRLVRKGGYVALLEYMAPTAEGVVGIGMGSYMHNIVASDGTFDGTRIIGQAPVIHSLPGLVPILARRGRMFIHDENTGPAAASVTDGKTVEHMGNIGGKWNTMGEYHDGVVFTAATVLAGEHLGGVYTYSDAGVLSLIADYDALGGDIFHSAQIERGIVFALKKDDGATELWTSDGSSVGTQRIPIEFQPGQTIEHFVVNHRRDHLMRTIFVVRNADGLHETWASDGTLAGTERILAQSNPHFRVMGEVNRRTVFLDVWSNQMFSTDGTAAGTQLIGASDPIVTFEFIDTGRGIAYFVNADKHGTELWQTDGTAKGTRMTMDLVPGAAGSDPSIYGFVGGSLIFAATYQGQQHMLKLTGNPRVPVQSPAAPRAELFASTKSIESANIDEEAFEILV